VSLEDYLVAKKRLEDAESLFRSEQRALYLEMEESKREAVTAAARWLYLKDGERGAVGACWDVIRSLAPWFKDLDAEEIYDIMTETEDQQGESG
jgi:hypothetical protein